MKFGGCKSSWWPKTAHFFHFGGVSSSFMSWTAWLSISCARFHWKVSIVMFFLLESCAKQSMVSLAFTSGPIFCKSIAVSFHSPKIEGAAAVWFESGTFSGVGSLSSSTSTPYCTQLRCATWAKFFCVTITLHCISLMAGGSSGLKDWVHKKIVFGTLRFHCNVSQCNVEHLLQKILLHDEHTHSLAPFHCHLLSSYDVKALDTSCCVIIN